MTKNERRKNNQNNLEEKLLSLKLKDLERKQCNLQQAIKRERYKLLDQFMNSKANNMSYLRKSSEEPESNIDLSALQNAPRYVPKTEGQDTERFSKSSRSRRNSYSSFDTHDLLKYANFINQPPPTPKPNNFSKIDERFIDQKVKYFPSYLRKTNTLEATVDIDTALNRIKNRMSANAQFCTKHKKHRLAQMKADLYNGSKDMLGSGNDEKIDFDKQMAEAEAAAEAEIAAAAALHDNEYEEHFSFGSISPTSRQQLHDSKTPLPAITPSNHSRNEKHLENFVG